MKRKILCTLALIGAMSMQTFAAPNMAVTIDGKAVAGGNAVVENGITYIAVRPFAEAMGLNVNWEAETKTVTVTNNGPLSITFTIGENAYTFAKTAPMKLSGEPIVIDSASYIPADVVTDLLNYDVTAENNVVNIVTGSETAEDEIVSGEAAEDESTENDSQEKAVGTVKEVSESEILFEDDEMGQVRLNKSEDVIVKDSLGNDIDIDEIKEGDKLEVVYSDAMTKSLPPLNNPVSITLISAEENEDEKAAGEGVVSEVSEKEILFTDDVRGDVRLNKSENVKVTDEDGNEADIDSIEKGDKLKVVYGDAMTMSIPPLNNPVSVVILK